MIRKLKLFLVDLVLFINLSHGLPRAHIPAFYMSLNFVQSAVFSEIGKTVRVQIVCDYVQSFFCCPNCQRPDSTKDICQKLSCFHVLQESISLLLQSGAPIHFLKIQFKNHSNLLNSYQIIFLACHMLQDWSSIYVVQFLGFVHDCFDVWAFQQSYFSNNLLKFILLRCQIVMSHVPNSLKAVWIRNLYKILWRFQFYKPIENLLIGEVFKVQFDFCFFDCAFILFIRNKGVFNFEIIMNQDQFLFVRFIQDSLKVWNFQDFAFPFQKFMIGVGIIEIYEQSFDFPGLSILLNEFPNFGIILHFNYKRNYNRSNLKLRQNYILTNISMIQKTKKLNVPAHKQCIQNKIAIVGDQQSGKSCFVSRYINNQYPSYYQATLGVEAGNKYIPVKNGLIHVTLWDFSGKLDFAQIRNEFYKEAHLIFVFVDLSSKQSVNGVDYWLKQIHESTRQSGSVPTFLVGSKSDVKKFNEIGNIAKEKNCTYMQICSKTGDGIQQLMQKALYEIK